MIVEEAQTLGRMARATIAGNNEVSNEAAAHALVGGCEIVVPLAGLVDVDKECERMRGEIVELDKQIASRSGRLDNARYVERAPAHVVASDRAILAEMQEKVKQLRDKVASLCG